MNSETPEKARLGLLDIYNLMAPDSHINRFVDIVEESSEKMVLKIDQVIAGLPAMATVNIYDFEKNIWSPVSGQAVSCVAADNPGNFLIDMTLDGRMPPPAIEPSDPRIQAIIQHMDFLLNLKFISLLPRNTLWAVLNRLQYEEFKEGEKIITQGKRGDAVYFIQKGGCYVIVDKPGAELQLSTKREGAMVGEMSLLTDEPRPANIVAATDVQMWKINRDCFSLLVEEHARLRNFLAELVCKRLESDGMTTDLAIGKYTIGHKIGEGAWAVVYMGHHMSLGRKVAIKLLKHEMSVDPDFHARFVEEAKIIAKMQHRNIINIYDVEIRFNMLFIIMEYLEGHPLDIVLKKEGVLPVRLVVDILMQTCSGLAYAHRRGIVHQDIKPDNLFLLKGNQLKILDFGLACPFGSEHIEMEGTLQYMSPEQIESYPVDGRTDLYGLGITAFHLLTGRLPYPDDNAAALREMHLNNDIPDPRDFVKNVPPLLAEFIMTCSRRNPEERYESADAALNVLKLLLKESIDCIQPAMPQNMSSIHIFYDDEQAKEVTVLLEEFAEKIKRQGLRLQLADFRHFLYH